MAEAPHPQHTVSVHGAPVLSLVTDHAHGRMFAGTLSGAIYVWDVATQQERAELVGHTRSVLALALAPSRGWLFSSSCDSTVRVWDAHRLAPLALIYPATDNVGDILSLAWCEQAQTLYFGCQNTSIQWIQLGGAWSAMGVRASRPHKFFDAEHLGAHAEMLVRRTAVVRADGAPAPTAAPAVLGVDADAVAASAHYGYVYSLSVLAAPQQPVLASGAGDGCVRLWSMHAAGILPLTTLAPPGDDAVLALASWHHTLFAGRQGGAVQVWDLASRSLIRTLAAHTDDVLALEVVGGAGDAPELYSAGADGRVCHWDRYFRCAAAWTAHAASVQACAWLDGAGAHTSWLARPALLATGASDAQVRLWTHVTPRPEHAAAATGATGATGAAAADPPLLCAQARADAPRVHARAAAAARGAPDALGAPLLARLARLVHFRSVSPRGAAPAGGDDGGAAYHEDSRRAAHFLRDVLQDLGASDVHLLPTGAGLNPLVLGTFRGSRAPGRRRCLFYGHYDCVPAGGAWDSDPWTLHGRDGYVYGRGVSDNKGPVLAVAHAAAELLHAQALDVDVVMLLEGEQETGSRGLVDAVRAHRAAIGPIDVVLLCNSYWIGEDRPCVTVGLRGVVHATVRITGRRPDRHSGVEGGAETEPMMEMVKVLASLTHADGRVALPGFYDGVRAVSDDEMAYYAELARIPHAPAHSARGLQALWRMPSLSIHKVSNSGGSSLIANSVEAALSMRVVPDQDAAAIAALLRTGLERSFAALHSVNHLDVQVHNRADWWLGALDAPHTRALADAVHAEWGVAPLHILEGGSIPGVAILEKELGAHAVHLPMGQASDHAHLPNERIRLVNLECGQAVVRRFFTTLAHQICS